MYLKLFQIISLFMLFSGISSLAHATLNDRYIGYYYPAPNQTELYCSRVPNLKDANKRRRVGFIIGIKEGMNKQPYESPYAVFAKGNESTKLIIISKQDGYLGTVYRARALLADLSTSARTTPIFAQSNAPEELTFLDLIGLLGFKSVTLSDGDAFAHQILILPNQHPKCPGNSTN
ncbi:hypothetical protein [Sneathiella glossodoripedis]|uniref:hypothetical protein n=1 Tax=Sneathiella glossodoripedis TaxID=418853 RepID=UPI00046EA726|nr:hypothetical protein [Sneathiella glossodoripedis]